MTRALPIESAIAGPTAATDILGVQVSALTMPKTVSIIERWVANRERHYACACTVHTVMECQHDAALLRAVNGAGLRVPAEMSLVWLLRHAGFHEVTRVYGPDLMLELCARSALTRFRHYFYGGAAGVAEEVVEKLHTRTPELNVAGTHTPSVVEAGVLESKETIETINASGADIVWVDLGTANQERWVANHRPLLTAPVLIAVGPAFDFLSGRVRRAPDWIQRSGLEWAFRLGQDPARSWRRDVRENAAFARDLLLNGNIRIHRF